MTREKKNKFRNNLKLFYITSIQSLGGFNPQCDSWLFNAASKTYNISYRTARRYYYEVTTKEFRDEYCY